MKYPIVFRYLTFLAATFLLSSCGKGTDKSTVSQSKVDIPALHTRAEELMHGKEWDEVQNFYGTQAAILREQPTNWDASLKLAELFMQEARITGDHPYYYPAALQMIDPVLAAQPADKDIMFRALSHKASIQLSLHAFDQALLTAEKAVAINPYNAYIYGCLVDAHVEMGRYSEAVAYCDKMVSIRPDLRSYSRVSYLRELHGDYKGAIEAMEMAVKAGYPGYEQTEWARLQLGKLYEKKGDSASATKVYEACLEARPNYPFALAALANLEAGKGNYAQAEKWLNQAIDIIPEIGFNISLAKIYAKTGREQAAAEMKKVILNMFDEDMAAGHNMNLEAGHFYLELMDDPENALKCAMKEYSIRPDNTDINALLAEIYAKKGDKSKARIHLSKAMQLNKSQPELSALRAELASS